MKEFAGIILAALASMSLNAPPAAAQDQSAIHPTAKNEPERAVKRHSHTQEKTGAPEQVPVAQNDPSRPNPQTDRSRHFHPRDR